MSTARIWRLGIRFLVALPCAAVACAWLSAGQARGSHGGRESAWVIGLEADERKVYYAAWRFDESGRLPRLFYFDLAASRPELPVRHWAINHWDEAASALWELGRRLEHLRRDSTDKIDLRIETIRTDTMRVGVAREIGCVRYFLRARVRDQKREATVELTSYREPRVRVSRLFKAPSDPQWSVVVLSYFGVPVEECYELEVPVLLTTPAAALVKVGPVSWE